MYVKNEKGNDSPKSILAIQTWKSKADDPARRKSFRARHNCDNPGPKLESEVLVLPPMASREESAKDLIPGYDWDGETIFDHEELLAINPQIQAFAERKSKLNPLQSNYMFNNPGDSVLKKQKRWDLTVFTQAQGWR